MHFLPPPPFFLYCCYSYWIEGTSLVLRKKKKNITASVPCPEMISSPKQETPPTKKKMLFVRFYIQIDKTFHYICGFFFFLNLIALV